MIRSWRRYVAAAYRPWIQLPYAISWALGLTALFALATGAVTKWRPGWDLLITVVTLVVTMLLIRAMDDIRDLQYDRRVNPGRPLPSGLVRERDLVALVAIGSAGLLLLNLGRGAALVILAVQIGYTGVMVTIERRAGWPSRDRLGLQLAVNMPILAMLSLYVYAGFLRAVDLGPSAVGFVVVVAATVAALCPEIGRKATRQPRPDERTYVTVLGPSGTSLAALAAAAVAAAIVLVCVTPWRPGAGWGWLVLVPLAAPALGAVRFAFGGVRWPVLAILVYMPALYTSFLAAGWLTKGAPA